MIAAQQAGEPARPAIEVVHFQRPPVEGGYSIERIFEDVRAHLPEEFTIRLVVGRHPNVGFLPRLRNAIDAWRARGQVNHVLGDTQYLAWFLPRDRTTITVHDCVSLERLSGWRRAILWALWYWWPLKRTREITVPSDFTRSHLHRWVRYPDERISTIHPALSDEFAFAPPRPHDQWSRLLHIGMMANKNLLRVIEAVAGMDVVLVLIGQMRPEYVAALEQYGVRYENHQDLSRAELIEQYRAADILVFASTYEGFGMPIIEAQAIGRPVVTSSVASMPEAAGGAACLVDPFDVSSIRAGIERVLADGGYAAQLIADGRANARAYGIKAIADRYAAVYRRIAERASGHV